MIEWLALAMKWMVEGFTFGGEDTVFVITAVERLHE